MIISGKFRPDAQFYIALNDNSREHLNTYMFHVLARVFNVRIQTIHKVADNDQLVDNPQFWIDSLPRTTPIWLLINEPRVHCTTVMPNDLRSYRWVDKKESPIQFLKYRFKTMENLENKITFAEDARPSKANEYFNGFRYLQQNN